MSDAIFKLIGEQLQLVRGKAPEDREIGAWFGDLSGVPKSPTRPRGHPRGPLLPSRLRSGRDLHDRPGGL